MWNLFLFCLIVAALAYNEIEARKRRRELEAWRARRARPPEAH